MKRDRAILTWAYLVEALLVILIYCVMIAFLGHERLVGVIQSYWQVFSATAGGLFAVGVGAVCWFSQMLESDFGKYLHWRKADMQYTRAYQIQTVLFLVTAVAPMTAMFGDNAAAGHVAWITCVYAFVNGITVVQNTVGLVRIRQEFRSKHDAIVTEMTKESE